MILAGDFNCIENTQLDKIGGNRNKGTSGSVELKEAGGFAEQDLKVKSSSAAGGGPGSASPWVLPTPGAAVAPRTRPVGLQNAPLAKSASLGWILGAAFALGRVRAAPWVLLDLCLAPMGTAFAWG